tara:strand:- start:658 stop:1542 length:885 start_codon:yes stop_codon:yes gene_type:complete
MNILSLFDGMSCGQIALDKLGIKVDNYFASEVDSYAIKVTQKNYPKTIQLGSILDVSGVDLPSIDLLYGGSPCQSFSRQGNNTGFDGKSGLFWEFIRVLKEVKPKFFLLENVVMKKEWEDIISSELGVKPIKINSSLVSAQKRNRLYWTNIPGVCQPLDRGVNVSDIIDISRSRPKYEDKGIILGETNKGLMIKNATAKGYLESNNFDGVSLAFPNSTTRRGRVSVGKTSTLDTSCNHGFTYNKSIYHFNIIELERLQTVPDNYTDSVSDSQRKRMLGNGWTVDVIAHIFGNLI